MYIYHASLSLLFFKIPLYGQLSQRGGEKRSFFVDFSNFFAAKNNPADTKAHYNANFKLYNPFFNLSTGFKKYF